MANEQHSCGLVLEPAAWCAGHVFSWGLLLGLGQPHSCSAAAKTFPLWWETVTCLHGMGVFLQRSPIAGHQDQTLPMPRSAHSACRPLQQPASFMLNSSGIPQTCMLKIAACAGAAAAVTQEQPVTHSRACSALQVLPISSQNACVALRGLGVGQLALQTAQTL